MMECSAPSPRAAHLPPSPPTSPTASAPASTRSASTFRTRPVTTPSASSSTSSTAWSALDELTQPGVVHDGLVRLGHGLGLAEVLLAVAHPHHHDTVAVCGVH